MTLNGWFERQLLGIYVNKFYNYCELQVHVPWIFVLKEIHYSWHCSVQIFWEIIIQMMPDHESDRWYSLTEWQMILFDSSIQYGGICKMVLEKWSVLAENPGWQTFFPTFESIESNSITVIWGISHY